MDNKIQGAPEYAMKAGFYESDRDIWESRNRRAKS
jgi:hypothetical protein